MNEDRIGLPPQITVEWCLHQAARILLSAETVLENGDRAATYVALADAWRDLAQSATDS